METKSKLKCRYLVYYNNGYSEFVDRIGMIYEHLVSLGIIKILVDLDDAKMYIADGQGSFKEEVVTQVSGLL